MRQSILAVDDEPHMLTLLERIITEKTGYGITTTSNSLEIPQLLAEKEYDVIISDLRMPGMNGIDVLRYVNENQRPEVVVLITAFGSLESATEALKAGVFDYIVKPFKKEQIIFTVERAMHWQQIKKQATTLGACCDARPFDEAVELFKVEYVRRLAARTGGAPEEIAAQSGLPVDQVAAILQKTD